MNEERDGFLALVKYFLSNVIVVDLCSQVFIEAVETRPHIAPHATI